MRIIEQTARASYGKLLAILAKASGGDISLAEDCLSSAFLKALQAWPATGAPPNPEGWIIKTAKNEILDRFRHLRVQDKNNPHLLDFLEEEAQTNDRRLELLFLCAHPAIPAEVRTPLMLQTVLGFSAQKIGSVFLASPAAMEKRLVRAKAKIKNAGIPFEIPPASEMAERLSAVLEAIYAVYGSSWDEMSQDLEEEATFLARLVCQLLPDQAEAKGLLSLILFCGARKAARRKDGRYVPMEQQDQSLWHIEMIEEAEILLQEASLRRSPGRFQYEAAIQSAHFARLLNRQDTSKEISAFYREILSRWPSIGGHVAYASFLVLHGEEEKAAKILDQLNAEAVKAYQPYWVARALVEEKIGSPRESRSCYERAIGLTADPAVVQFLRQKADKKS